MPLSQVGRHPARIKFREVQGLLSRATLLFLGGGWQSLPSRSSLCITLGPSAYGYDRTGNFWSPHRERTEALQCLNHSAISWGDNSLMSRAPSCLAFSDCGRSCGSLPKISSRWAFAVRRYRNFKEFKEELVTALRAGLFFCRSFPSFPALAACLADSTCLVVCRDQTYCGMFEINASPCQQGWQWSSLSGMVPAFERLRTNHNPSQPLGNPPRITGARIC